ncbi:hypothetical protein PAXRUDRAFT_21095 [Paxillus rubicundulus Ve08.2h10]|uniref:Uncharacterized protein n=1 Tax=Paxillus rubicundulus Ve08.2h10 TaxID=930991 RepID=A0A0D0CQX8_9AGAM|nr:hypothetical protein PAXRUDRAFT_21095 [Paxillus rubicundulus Ve08.2h10]
MARRKRAHTIWAANINSKRAKATDGDKESPDMLLPLGSLPADEWVPSAHYLY